MRLGYFGQSISSLAKPLNTINQFLQCCLLIALLLCCLHIALLPWHPTPYTKQKKTKQQPYVSTNHGPPLTCCFCCFVLFFLFLWFLWFLWYTIACVYGFKSCVYMVHTQVSTSGNKSLQEPESKPAKQLCQNTAFFYMDVVLSWANEYRCEISILPGCAMLKW